MCPFRKYCCLRGHLFTLNAFLTLSIRMVYSVEVLSDEPANCRLLDRSGNDYQRIVLICQSLTHPSEVNLYANNVNLDSSECLIRTEDVATKDAAYNEKRFECGTYRLGQYRCKCGVYTSNTININPPNVVAPKGNVPLAPDNKMTVDFTDDPGKPANSSAYQPMPQITYIQYATEKVLYIVAAVFGITLLVVPIMWFVFRRRFRKDEYAGVAVQDTNGKVELHRMKT